MGMFDLPNDPAAGGVSNYGTLEARRRIALQLMANAARKGYPKTVGEGLSSIGDALGEIGAYRAMLKQEQQREAGLQKAAADKGPSGTKTSDATDPEVSDVVAPVATIATDKGEVPLQQTASINPVVIPPEKDTPAPVQAPPPEETALPPPSYVPSPARPVASPVVRGMTPQQPIALDPMSAAGARQGTVDSNSYKTGLNGIRPPQALAPWLDQTVAQYYGPQTLSGRGVPAYTPADAGADARLSDVVGMQRGPTGAYSYPRTASLRTGDVQSDAPLTGISAKTGAAVGDTMQQRDDMTKLLMMRDQGEPVPGVPQPNPTMPGANPPPISPTPTAAGAGPDPRLAQATGIVAAPPILPPQNQMPPSIPAPGTPAPLVPTAPSVARTPVPEQFKQEPMPPPKIQMEPKGPDQLHFEKMKDLVPDDPYLSKVYEDKAAREEAKRAFKDKQNQALWDAQNRQYETAKSAYQEFWRTNPERELTLQKAEDERAKRAFDERITQGLGGVDPAVFANNIVKSHEAVKSIIGSSMSIGNARRMATDESMFTGSDAEIKSSLNKLAQVLGFPPDPRVSATEQFKTYMAGITAQQRQALVGGANISDKDLAAASDAAGANVKLERGTILAALRAAENLNTVLAVEHQKKLEAFSLGIPARQQHIYGQFGLPMEQIVPQEAVNILRRDAADPTAHKEFDETFHTPGLSRKVLMFRR
jgi:hypothetical protein